jgi:hypothetical protein
MRASDAMRYAPEVRWHFQSIIYFRAVLSQRAGVATNAFKPVMQYLDADAYNVNRLVFLSGLFMLIVSDG